MNLLAASQERARVFNESAAIERDYLRRQTIRRLASGRDLSPHESWLDDLDWLEAVRTNRRVYARDVTVIC